MKKYPKAKCYDKQDSMDCMETEDCFDCLEQSEDTDMDYLDGMEKAAYKGVMKKKKLAMDELCPDMMMAHAYVPWQYYTTAFCPEEALMKGTLFPELWGAYPIPE